MIAVSAVLLAVIVSGAVAGLWTGRWGSSRRLKEAASRLRQVPLTIGDSWDGHSSELSAQEMAIAELEGYLWRRYIHRVTGTAVSVLLVCGRPGPISVHIPEVCYAGQGYFPVGEEKSYTGPSGSGWQFRVRDFQKDNAAIPTRLRIFLAWGYEKEWTAPAKPRLTFAANPYLYKLYVVREITRVDEPLEKDPAAQLIQGLVPQLQKALFSDF